VASHRPITKISLGNLYNHFENKTALIAEIAGLEAEELVASTKALKGKAPPDKRMERFIKAYFKVVSGKENAVLTAEIMAESMRNPSIAAGYTANRTELITAILPVVKALYPSAEPEPRAELIIDMIEGAGIRTAFESAKAKKAALSALIAWNIPEAL
jgi:AcrR family transcriptional regulator